MLLTLVQIIKDDKILLGKKKRGFGMGKWNGFGGKVAEGESIEDAAKRECLEEAGIEPLNLEPRGTLHFHYEDTDKVHETYLFSATDYKGEVTETEEMLPQWFSIQEIPYEGMWADDKHWMHLFLAGKNIKGVFHFAADQKTIKDFSVEEI